MKSPIHNHAIQHNFLEPIRTGIQTNKSHRFKFNHDKTICGLLWRPVKVTEFRRLFDLDSNPCIAHCDAWGLKRLFSYALRRWLAGGQTPRDPWPF